MASFLVLDWDYQQLLIVSASVKHGRVRLRKAIAFREETSPNPAEVEALGRLLGERLKAAGMRPAPVLACLGRDRIILKEIRYPPVPPAEEPGVVRFQVIKDLNDPAEEVVIDYAPDLAPGPNGRRALAMVIRRELLTTYQAICRAAGLKLVGLTPRPFGTLACLRAQLGSTPRTPPPEPADAAVALLTLGQPWAEFCVVRGDTLLFARPLPVLPTLAAEVRRNLAVYTSQSSQDPVRAIYVADGAEHMAVREELHNLTGLPVHLFDPFGGLESPGFPIVDRGAFAGAVGLLHAQARWRGQPINFMQPKEPRKPQDPNRRRVLTVAALAGVLLLAAVSICYSQLARRNRRLEELFDERTALDLQLSKTEEDSKRRLALEDWNQSGIVWLDELYDLVDRFPEPTTLRLTQVTGDPLARTGKEKPVARMTLKGITTNEYQAVDTLVSRLVEDGHYRVEPKVLSRNSGADRNRFPQQFQTRVDIDKRPPSQYLRRLADPAPDHGKPGQRADEDLTDFGSGTFGGGGQ